MVTKYIFIYILVCFGVIDAKVLDVKCGSPETEPATIIYTGDARAISADGRTTGTCSFKEDVRTGIFTLKIGYSKNQGQSCLFKMKTKNLPIYQIGIETKTVHEFIESAEDERYIVECSFALTKENVTLSVPVTSIFNPPEVLFSTEGKPASSKFSLHVADIFNQKITIKVMTGRIVKLESYITYSSDEVGNGYFPMKCTVGSIDGSIQLLVLNDGCGTGFPWKTDDGFVMNGTIGHSPTFRMFRVKKGEGVTFRCIFVMCSGECNGMTCVKSKSRGKRSVGIGMDYNNNIYGGMRIGTANSAVSFDNDMGAHIKVHTINIME